MRAPGNAGRRKQSRWLKINSGLLLLGLAIVVAVYTVTQRELDDIPMPVQPKLSLRQRIQNLSRPHYFLTVMAMFKNEAHIMREWIDHYIDQGVDHFLLIDNNSTDPFREALQAYIKAGLVTLVSTSRQHFQAGAYNLFFKQHLLGRSQWVLTVDLDEFVYSPVRGKGITDVLRQLEARPDFDKIGQVCIPWKMFGSSGYTQQPRCVVQSFTKREARPTTDTRLWKCAARSAYIIELSVHQHETLGLPLCPDGSMPAFTLMHANESEVERAIAEPCGDLALERALLQLNHYPIQARDYFMRVKAVRGDNVWRQHDGLRDEKYFERYDKMGSQVEDRGLVARQNGTDLICSGPEARQAVGMEAVLEEVRAMRAKGGGQWADPPKW